MKIERLRPVGLREVLLGLALGSLVAGAPGVWAQRLVNARAAAAQAANDPVKPEPIAPASSGPGSDGSPSAPGDSPANPGPPETQARARGRGNRNGVRDPFRAPQPPRQPVAATKVPNAGPPPPGIPGLKVDQLRLQGIIQEPSTHSMIAMVTNGAHLAYFLRPSDRLRDGTVSRITPDAVYLLRTSHSHGSPKTGEVVLRLEPGQGDSR